MKEFFKTVLAVICGLFLMGIISIFILGGFVSALSSGKNSSPSLPKEGVLEINMSKFNLVEIANEDPISMLQSFQSGDNRTSISIYKAVQAINAAANDPAVQYIFLKADGASGSISHLEEFRKALRNFRVSGKPIIAYTVNPSTGSYYLSSVADKIYSTDLRGGNINIIGVGGRMIFLKDLLDKLGVNMQLIRHGKYKSAGEMFIRNSPSPENMEQQQSMINSIWNSLSSEIAASRSITVESLNNAIDNLELCFPEDLVNAGLVDSLLSNKGMQERLANLAVKDDIKDVSFIKFNTYVNAKVKANEKAKNKLAVIYADGEIVEGKGKQNIAGDRFAGIISKIAADSSVKAVVLRVNSPGGSVLASEKIKEQLDLLGEVKPLIASYGDYAASGGYWISNNCDKIFSDATTLTGSIGVFSLIPDVSGVYKNTLHIGVTNVNSNKHSDIYSTTRPLDESEKEFFLRSVEDIYDKFTRTVAQGRNLEPEYVDEIGQGRVWTGAQGLENGLVDEIGTLEDAIRWAAIAGGEVDLEKWNICSYPKPVNALDSVYELLEQSQNQDKIEDRLKAYLEKCTAPVAVARIPYLIEIK